MPISSVSYLKRASGAELQLSVANWSLVCFIFITFAMLCVACGRSSTKTTQQPAANEALSSAPANGARNESDALNANGEGNKGRPRIVAFGDSLTAGYGLAPEQSYPWLLQQKLDRDGYNYEVVNAGVSGDTSAGGLRRIEWALDDSNGKVEIVILELGANDILRGQPVAQMRRNLAGIIEAAQRRGARVLLAGMLSPPNWGAEYARDVEEAYRSLAAEYKLPLIPFFLDRVALRRELNLEDGAHPNAEGTRIVAETVYQALRPMLEQKR